MGVSEEPERPQPQNPAPNPDPARATFSAWLDHALTCHYCRHAPARHCYHSERLGDRHREATRAARPQP